MTPDGAAGGAALARERQRFPTRNFPYGRCGAAAPDAIAPRLEANRLHRRVVGLDDEPRPMTAEELAGLDDPLGRLLRSGAAFPLTLTDVLAALDARAGEPDGLPDQLVFLAADGGHIAWSAETDELQRAFRFAVARGRGEFRLLISSSTLVDSADDAAFLQIIGWDPTHELFHYYERLAGTFLWAGDSRHALVEPTRGNGPFDSHVNGSLVMKELRAPWLNWHAPQAGINAEAFAPDDPMRHHPLFLGRATAERLESEVVRPGIQRWNAARIRKARAPDGGWGDVPLYLRHLLTDTSVNLATSDTASHTLTDVAHFRPPLTFFLNRDVLFDALELVPDDPEAANIQVASAAYRGCLARYDVHRSDGAIRIDGDSHFAFLTPEPAFEDSDVVATLLMEGMLGARLAAALAMVDFTNPVFSERRARLMRHVPAAVAGPDVAAALDTALLASVEAAVRDDPAAAEADSPERELLSNWALPAEAQIARIGAYLAAVRAGGEEEGVVDGWFRLAEHRRRLFRRRDLFEFQLTTPRTSIPPDAPPMRMTEAGRAEAAA